MKLTIGIPTYLNYMQLTQTLLSLTEWVEYPYRIYVLNNGPAELGGRSFKEDLLESIRYPELHVIQAEKNLGWAGGINRIFEEAEETEFFCMLNDDVVFPPGSSTFFRSLCGWFKSPQVGAAGPCSNFVMGLQNQLEFRSGVVCTSALLIGFCMVVRSKLFAEIGGLDEGLPGGDDFDLSMLIREKGYQLIVDRSQYLYHHGAQTGPKVQPDWNQPHYTNRVDNALISKHGFRNWWETQTGLVGGVKLEGLDVLLGEEEPALIKEWVEGDVGLDLGCGSNKILEYAKGVDLTPKGSFGLVGGQKRRESMANLEADITDLPLDDDTQDFCIASHSLEHLIDPIKALEEWQRVLKPDGVLIVIVPDHGVQDTILLDWSHVHAYTVDSLEKLIHMVGFHIEESRRLPGLVGVKARKI